MPSIDMPLEQMRQYKPATYRESDFESFWEKTLAESAKQPLNGELIPYPMPYRGLEAFAVRLDGYQGGRLAGWNMRPAGRGKFPGLCLYHGYSMRGARPLDMVAYASLGMCVLSMDCRGQNGQSQDGAVYPDGHHLGWMTQGIRSPQTYYYRYVYTDCVRALELLAQREEVDASRLAITGGSQGGALTLSTAALSRRPILALADIPFLCDFQRSMAITPSGPYPELASFFRTHPDMHQQGLHTLSYFDCMNLAPMIRCRTVIANGLWDDICAPSTIFAAYNHITAQKQMEVYPFHRHETPYEHNELKLQLLAETLRP